jgi:hypothetical protein
MTLVSVNFLFVALNMKNALFLFCLLIVAGCSKDDDNAAKPNGNGSTPELEVFVFSNHRYPYLAVGKDGTGLYIVNDSAYNVLTPYYSMQTVTPGTYTFSVTQDIDWPDTNMIDAVVFWKRMVVILRGDTIADFHDSADANGTISRYFVKQVN